MIEVILFIIVVGICIGAILKFFYDRWWLRNKLKKFKKLMQKFSKEKWPNEEDKKQLMTKLKNYEKT